MPFVTGGPRATPVTVALVNHLLESTDEANLAGTEVPPSTAHRITKLAEAGVHDQT